MLIVYDWGRPYNARVNSIEVQQCAIVYERDSDFGDIVVAPSSNCEAPITIRHL